MSLDALGQLEGPVESIATSWTVLPWLGSPLTYQRPGSHSRSAGSHSMAAAVITRALSRIRCAAIAAAAPDTGVDRTRTSRARRACCSCRRG